MVSTSPWMVARCSRALAHSTTSATGSRPRCGKPLSQGRASNRRRWHPSSPTSYNLWAVQEHDMAGVKLIVMYPRPKDINAFEKLYQTEHVPMAVQKLTGKTKLVATKVIASPQG